jgi:ribulose-phosphate 3-epimerase
MIIPVILEKNLEDIEHKIKIVDSFADLIQLDLADGKLVDGETFLDIEKICQIQCNTPLEIHFMVKNPVSYIGKKCPNVKKVCSQVEADNIPDFIKQAKAQGYRVGLSIGPTTDNAVLEPYLGEISYVQFMTITPGAQGRKLIPAVLDKIKAFSHKHPEVRVQVDGGVKLENIYNLKRAGVDDFVVGSSIFGDPDPKEKYAKLTYMSDQISSVKKEKIEKIAFLGGAGWTEDDEPYKAAFETARLLALAGYEIVDGGGPGVMRAATKGAHAGGGRALAITYHPNKAKRHYEGVDKENDFDDEVMTLDYFDRTKVMLQTTQVHIVFNGSLGTLSEFGMTWISSWIHEPDNKPIVLFGEFWQEYVEWIQEHMLLDKNEQRLIKICKTPQEVLDYINSLN